MTSFSAPSKSAMVTMSLSSISGLSLSSSSFSSGSILRRVFMAASLQRYSASAPTKPWVTAASFSRSTSGVSGMCLVWIWSISYRPFLSGTLISISRSKRPGLLRAGSMAFGRLVAAMTMTFPLASSPSMSERSWLTTLRSTSPVTSSLLGAIESISSMNMMVGAFSLASLKISRSLASDSP